jgi:flagellin-like protein
MKKMWKFRKDSRAVSPVIATILMVAITVVLAAVLYVMVSGYGGGGETAPTGDFTGATKDSTYVEKLTFGPFSKDTTPTQIKIVIGNGTTTPVTYLFQTDTTGTLSVASGSTADPGIDYVNYTDLGGDSKVSNGDYITIDFDAVGTGSHSFVASIVYVATGDIIGDISFTW